MANEHKEQSKPVIWAGKKPSEEEIAQILEDHKTWLEGGRNGEPPHNLFNSNLENVDFSGADLRYINFAYANLCKTNFLLAKLEGGNFEWAVLNGANFILADCRNAVFKYAFFIGAILCTAKFTGSDLRAVEFKGSNCSGAKFGNSDLEGSDFVNANLTEVEFRESNIGSADFSNAILFNANFRHAISTNVKFNRKTKVLGCNAFASIGSAKFKDFVRTQEFIEELRQSKFGNILYWIWLITCDCGRSIWPWFTLSLAFICMFAGIFFSLGKSAFSVPPELGFNFETMLYYSVVTFSTLGFGDITPLTHVAARWVMAEVFLGYLMLGGLITIFATKITRRG
ncbi:pentapeptide repeat-containing protein [Dethiosulfatarculus sandiegensis]|uniref:Potassium channel domain-containing protein n=1 Tax=Dethiosulfatarculus sandiegensis TaxID=1429043 RepID=A0A0D2JT35_9BACT|nr:pentapeptide repeat-containing protein [Dethiosulfatarculus sandiegensis]KIX12640.1 hypothetical protein X474_18015 [Dethiosulfatarculus sandiegensis]